MKGQEVKKQTEEALDELATALDQGKSDRLKQYLTAMGRFRRYSLGNIMLIGFQRPDATHVAGYRTWQRLGRHVKQGERGIRILAPIVRRKKNSDHGEDAGEEDAERELVSFRGACVFDIAQTEGRPLPEFAKVGGDPAEYLERLKTMVAERGIALDYSDSMRAEGLTSGKKIVLRSGLSSAEAFSTLVHELAHVRLHFGGDEKHRTSSKTVLETEAEAVAFVVSQAIGLDAAGASSDYIQLWDGDKDTLLRSLERIRADVGEILNGIQTEANPTAESRVEVGAMAVPATPG